MNKAALAQAFEVSPNSVTAWVRRGCPVTKQKNCTYLFNLTEVHAWREKTSSLRANGDQTISAAQLRKETALAGLRELELARKTGALVEKSKVEAQAFRTGRKVRNSLLGLPDRLAGVLASESDQRKTHALLTKEIHQTLEALCQRPAGRTRGAL